MSGGLDSLGVAPSALRSYKLWQPLLSQHCTVVGSSSAFPSPGPSRWDPGESTNNLGYFGCERGKIGDDIGTIEPLGAPSFVSGAQWEVEELLSL